MKTPEHVNQAVTTLREHLLQEVREAEVLLEQRRERLRTFESFEISASTSPRNEKAAPTADTATPETPTDIVRRTMATFGGSQFTSSALQARAVQLFQAKPEYLPVVSISKILNRLLTQTTPEVARLAKGAGRKEAIFIVAKK